MIDSHDPKGFYDKLQECLKALFKVQLPKFSLEQIGDQLILIMESDDDTVCFALFITSLESFISVYKGFKNLYVKNHSVWKNKTLSFVLCRSKDDKNLDYDFNLIESDIYFCRKYVISICQNLDDLTQELLRLPFLPFPMKGKGSLVRPPSAQSLLQNLNIKSSLASQIVVPQRSSAKTIVENLLNIESIEPINPITSLIENYEVKATEDTRIKNIEINAFRSYKTLKRFDLDADVIVLYGPNGLGKTSLFDAIDFVCTGRIGRLCRHRTSHVDFIELARHLSTSPSEGFVKMEVRQSQNDFSITRKINDWTYANLNTDKFDRVKTIQFLTSANLETKVGRIENIEKLFRATHLFGQSDSELLSEFSSDSVMPQDLVHRMLALDDYNSGLEKIEESLDLTEKMVLENEKELKNIQISISEITQKLKDLSIDEKLIVGGSHLRTTLSSLVLELRKYTDVSIEKYDLDPNQIRDMRGIVESILKHAQRSLTSLLELKDGFKDYEENQSKLRVIINEQSTAKKSLEDNELKTNQFKKSLLEVEEKIEQEKKNISNAEKVIGDLLKFQNIQNSYTKSVELINKYLNDKEKLVIEDEQNKINLQILSDKIQNIKLVLAKISSDYKEKLSRETELKILQNKMGQWISDNEKINELKNDILFLQKQIEARNAFMSKIRSSISVKKNELKLLENEYAKNVHNQNELTKLLDEVELHVQSSICPICGTDHDSTGALLEKIHNQKERRPFEIEKLIENSNKLKSLINDETSLLNKAQSEDKLDNNRLEEIAMRLTQVELSINAFESKLTQVGLNKEVHLKELLINKLEGINDEKEKLQVLSIQNESELKKSLDELNLLNLRTNHCSEKLNERLNSIQKLEEEILKLQTESEAIDFKLNSSKEDLEIVKEKATIQKKSSNQQLRILNEDATNYKDELDKLEKSRSELLHISEQINPTKDKLESLIQSYTTKYSNILKTKQVLFEKIQESIVDTEKRSEDLGDLKDKFINMENALDSTMKSAQIAELESSLSKLTITKESLTTKIKLEKSVQKWLINVKDILQKGSSSAVNNHINTFGPLSSLIQRRLHAVYGFNDVQLSSKGSEIHIKVGWQNSLVNPTDYFSDSQKQILMLSIFLASRLTQSWSGFAPIMMDDPVTHFDDLNAFGFVELIRGILSNTQGKKQFIISTCEERLFELMQKKFKNVSGGAIFYKFKGIDQNGPIVDKFGI